MQPLDALIITALGMWVVFVGLGLTALLIVVFGVVGRYGSRAAPAPGPVRQEDGDSVHPAPSDPAIVAVITTVLEVERRLYRAEHAGRLTISRDA